MIETSDSDYKDTGSRNYRDDALVRSYGEKWFTSEPQLTLRAIEELAGDEKRAVRLATLLLRIPEDNRNRLFVWLHNQSYLAAEYLGLDVMEIHEAAREGKQGGKEPCEAYLDAVLDRAL